MVPVQGPLFRDIERSFLESFRAFHARNPQVYELFRELALRARATGRQRYSAWAIMNRVRWDYDIETHDPQSDKPEFKLSNDFIALYARLLITHEPELEGFLVIRPMSRLEPDAA